jgi:hypothetical protein
MAGLLFESPCHQLLDLHPKLQEQSAFSLTSRVLHLLLCTATRHGPLRIKSRSSYSARDHSTSWPQPSRATMRVPTYDCFSIKECLGIALHVCRLRRLHPCRTGPYFFETRFRTRWTCRSQPILLSSCLDCSCHAFHYISRQ